MTTTERMAQKRADAMAVYNEVLTLGDVIYANRKAGKNVDALLHYSRALMEYYETLNKEYNLARKEIWND